MRRIRGAPRWRGLLDAIGVTVVAAAVIAVPRLPGAAAGTTVGGNDAGAAAHPARRRPRRPPRRLPQESPRTSSPARSQA